MSIEHRLDKWAEWVRAGGESAQGYPKQSGMASIYTFNLSDEGVSASGKPLTAQGKPTRSRKGLEPGEAPDGVWQVERAVSALRTEDARLWAVLVAKYLGKVPRRRDRIRKDEDGSVRVLYEILRQRGGEATTAYHERLGRRLFVSQRTFYSRLKEGQRFVSGYFEAAVA